MKKETITIQRMSAPDRYGDRTPDGAPIEVRGCVVWPRTGEEEGTAAEIIVDGQNVKIPWGQPVPKAVDTVTLRGEKYQVIGPPGVYMGKATIVVLKKVGQTNAGG